MDIITCITAVASCVTAIATAVTVIVAIKQFKKTLSENNRYRLEERAIHLKDNASLVDAWVVIRSRADSNEHFMVIDNASDASIHNVEIEYDWKTGRNGCVEGSKPIELKLLPRGLWIISKSYGSSYGWNFPKAILRSTLDEEYEPRFKEDRSHIVKSISFTDAHEGRWKKDCLNQLTSRVDG